jgi:hypothetical protein
VDPHYFEKLDPDPDCNPHQSKKLDPDPDPHHNQNSKSWIRISEAVEGL